MGWDLFELLSMLSVYVDPSRKRTLEIDLFRLISNKICIITFCRHND